MDEFLRSEKIQRSPPCSSKELSFRMKDSHKEVASNIGGSSALDIFYMCGVGVKRFSLLFTFILSAIKGRSCAGNVEEGCGIRPCREEKNKTTPIKNGKGTYRNVRGQH